MWHNKATPERKSLCLTCDSRQKSFLCDICDESKTADEFRQSTLYNRCDETRKIRCYQCSTAPCMFLKAHNKCKACISCLGRFLECVSACQKCLQPCSVVIVNSVLHLSSIIFALLSAAVVVCSC